MATRAIVEFLAPTAGHRSDWRYRVPEYANEAFAIRAVLRAYPGATISERTRDEASVRKVATINGRVLAVIDVIF